MICPECGEKLHRSHARGLKERIARRFTATRFYRCSDCGWRGKIQVEPPNPPSDKRLAFLIWFIGVLLALVIGMYAISHMNSSPIPRTTDSGEAQ